MKPFTRGFTVFEVIIYLGLFSILIGGAVVCAYNLFTASTLGGTRTELQEESDFALALIESSLTNAKTIDTPLSGMQSNELTVESWDGDHVQPIEFATSGPSLTQRYASGPPSPVTNSNVIVEYLHFRHLTYEGNGIDPDALETVLVLSAHTPSGAILTHTATSTIFLPH